MGVASVPSPTRKQLQTLIRGFLIQILPSGVEIVVGQGNRVPQPVGDNSVVIQPPSLKRLTTTVETWSTLSSPAPTVIAYEQDVAAKVQLHVFGANSADNVNMITTLLRSSYGVSYFAGTETGVSPLYCDDGQQIPFITGEDQFQDRYIVEATFQMSVTISAPQQFADEIALDLIEVDATYPP